MDFKGFIDGSYTLDRRKADCQNALNLYVRKNESTGEKMLIRRPGMTSLSATGAGGDRGMIVVKAATDRVFQVVGERLYEIDSAGTKTAIAGILSTSQGFVSMASNGLEILIATGSGVAGASGYLFNLTSGVLAAIPAGDYPAGATHAAFMDGYFIVNQGPTSRNIQISALYDGSSWDAADVSGTSRRPDVVLSLIVDHEQLILSGYISVEIWQNTGNADFPFEPISGSMLQKGIQSPQGIGAIDNTVAWLEADELGAGMVYKLAGGAQAARISTFAVEAWLQSQTLARLKAAEVTTFQYGGHSFWMLSVPGSDTTWVYDFATNLWHEWTYHHLGVRERHRVHSHVFAFGKHLIGDWENGNLYQLSDTVYTDNEMPIICERTAPHLHNDLKNFFVSEFGLRIETGAADVTLYEGDGATERAPQVSLLISKDDGYTFPVERTTSMGKIGERLVRAIWRRLGVAKDLVMRVRVTDPVPFVILGANIEIEAGRN